MIFEQFKNNHPLQKGITGAVVTFIIGLLLVIIPYETILSMLFVIIGLGIIIMNGIPCFIYWMTYDKSKDKKVLFSAILSTISVVVGLIFIFWRSNVISIILAIWLIILPIIRIIMAPNKIERLKKEIPYFIIALFLFFIPFEKILNWVIIAFGIVIMVISIIKIIYTFIWNKKMEKEMFSDDSDDSGNQNPPSGGQRVIIDAEVKDVE